MFINFILFSFPSVLFFFTITVSEPDCLSSQGTRQLFCPIFFYFLSTSRVCPFHRPSSIQHITYWVIMNTFPDFKPNLELLRCMYLKNIFISTDVASLEMFTSDRYSGGFEIVHLHVHWYCVENSTVDAKIFSGCHQIKDYFYGIGEEWDCIFMFSKKRSIR